MLCSVLRQDYYKILEVDYDATDDDIRSNYIRLALVCSVVSVFLLLGFPIGANVGVVVRAEVAPGQAESPGFYYLAIPRHKRGLPGYVCICLCIYF